MFLFAIQCISYTLSIGTFLLISTLCYIDWKRSEHIEVLLTGPPEHVVSDGHRVVFSMPIVCEIAGIRLWERRQVFKFPIGCDSCIAREERLASLRSRSPKRSLPAIKVE